MRHTHATGTITYISVSLSPCLTCLCLYFSQSSSLRHALARPLFSSLSLSHSAHSHSREHTYTHKPAHTHFAMCMCAGEKVCVQEGAFVRERTYAKQWVVTFVRVMNSENTVESHSESLSRVHTHTTSLRSQHCSGQDLFRKTRTPPAWWRIWASSASPESPERLAQ